MIYTNSSCHIMSSPWVYLHVNDIKCKQIGTLTENVQWDLLWMQVSFSLLFFFAVYHWNRQIGLKVICHLSFRIQLDCKIGLVSGSAGVNCVRSKECRRRGACEKPEPVLCRWFRVLKQIRRRNACVSTVP